MNDLTRTASFTGRGSASSISGAMKISHVTDTSKSTIDFNGETDIHHGTDAFRNGKAKLPTRGVLNINVHHMKLIFSGVYYY